MLPAVYGEGKAARARKNIPMRYVCLLEGQASARSIQLRFVAGFSP